MNINKKNVLVLAVAAFAFACSSGTNSDSNTQDQRQVSAEVSTVEEVSSENTSTTPKVATIEVEEDSFDFGVIKEGQKVERTFILKNVGDAPLILSGASASCGCTVPEYSGKPVAPGQTTPIKAVFDSNGQLGVQHKIILIASNASNGIVQLHLRGEVNSKN